MYYAIATAQNIHFSINDRHQDIASQLAHQLGMRFTTNTPGKPRCPLRVCPDRYVAPLSLPIVTYCLHPLPSPQYSCFHSAICLSFGLLKSTPMINFLPHTLNLSNLPNLLLNIGAIGVPIYYYNGSFQLYHGVARDDGFCLAFFPPGSITPGSNAHLTFANIPRNSNRPTPFSLFSSIPPLNTDAIFWHAPYYSSEYESLRVLGRACLCKFVPCAHDSSLISASFSHAIKTTHSLAIVGPPTDFEVTATRLLRMGESELYDHGCERVSEEQDLTKTLFRSTDCMLVKRRMPSRPAFFKPIVCAALTYAFNYYVYMFKLPKSHTMQISLKQSYILKIYASSPMQLLDRFISDLVQKFLGICSHVVKTFLAKHTFFGVQFRIVDTTQWLVPPRLVAHCAGLILLSTLFVLLHWIFGMKKYTRHVPLPSPTTPFDPRFTFFKSDLGHYILDRMVGHQRNRDTMMTIARRGMQELGYPSISHAAVNEWLDTLYSPMYGVVYQKPGCLNCFCTTQVRRRVCSSCRKAIKYPFYYQPITDSFSYIGLRPIRSVDPLFDTTLSFDPTVSITFKGHIISNLNDVNTVYHMYKPSPRGFGHSCGPVIYFTEPSVFAPSPVMTLVACAMRMALPPPFLPYSLETMPLLFSLFKQVFPGFRRSLTPFKHQVILERLPAPKRIVYLSALRNIENGLVPSIKKLTTFKAFAKHEKAVHFTYDLCNGFQSKLKRVPRLINSPKPELNVLLSPWTSAYSKHLVAIFEPCSHIFYASGNTPQNVNKHMQASWDFSLNIIEDDVSFMDLSQCFSGLSCVATEIVSCFDSPPAHVFKLLVAQITLNIKTPEITANLGQHNASGVPTTTISNSLVCILSRVFALAFVILQIPLSSTSFQKYLEIFPLVIQSIMMSVSGDDGYMTIRDSIYPYRFNSPRFLELYSKGFSLCGLDVGASKIRTFDEINWRLGTFLAMRPYYTTSGYCLGPELARRLSTAFWKLDSSLHPITWLSSVAYSLSIAAPYVPILRDIVSMVLRVVPNLKQKIDLCDEFSIFHNWSVEADFHPQSVVEMAQDYQFPLELYYDFKTMCDRCQTPFVHLNHPIFSYIAKMQ